MPTYEYECTKCGEQFDYLQSIKEAPKVECEKCGGALTKLLSAGTGLIFKGSGFYITDYKTKSGGEASSAGSGDKSGGAKEGSGSESKSGTSTESSKGSGKSSGETKSSTSSPSSSAGGKESSKSGS